MSDKTALFLQGYGRPLNEWSDRALTQTHSELVRALEHEPRASGRRHLQQNASILEAEVDRRAGRLSPERLADLAKGGALQSPLAATRADKAANATRNEANPEQVRTSARQLTDGRGADAERDKAGKGPEPG